MPSEVTEFRRFRPELLEQWRNAVIGTYAVEAHPYLENNKSPFTNPIGKAVKETTAELLEWLFCGEGEPPRERLSELIAIRAVQNFTTVQTIGFVNDLKRLCGSIVLPNVTTPEQYIGYLTLMNRIDTLLLVAFDIYTNHREKLATIRIEEARRRYSRILNDSRFLGTPVELEGAAHADIDKMKSNNHGADV